MTWFSEKWDDLIAYLIQNDIMEKAGSALIKIVLILVLGFIVIRMGKKIIHKLIVSRKKGPFRLSERREKTLLKLLENILVYTIYVAVVIMILDVLGFPVGALIGGAGIVGLAIGFGAQNLVKDVISGFFIIFEDQFSVGDFVRVGEAQGYVEEIGMRTTKIKSWTGELFVIPNGNIQEVTNYSIHNSVAVVDVSIAYEGNINQAEKVLEELLEELPDKYPQMVKKPELLGVQNLGASDIVLRVIAEVEPMTHWQISRALRKEIKQRFDEKQIEIPFPRMVMYTKLEEDVQKHSEREEEDNKNEREKGI
ncbi:MAG: mechanosensitive ion channel family protein [Bacillaceae bacterium]|nr:mechanosensitive ion channel family protein [Bacillaceae bacterium]